ncbi:MULTISPECIES: helix-turn-helix transcriptional regulator [Pseudomonas]|uniref:DeoR family transcriptional regulator n=3 Tax=Pseudomonas chlororaphis TaxID=587753 RepID=A0AAQ2YF71_9PSED|nr:MULTISPECIES: YafY family protein [Pseudomonas]AIC19937.1 DNA-binding protein [Pseudomonas chlororaphis]AUG40974.1 YafY family transcriptional regulator [Pseudomonas chlororaphis]AVO59028.1 YafY family transcriptional regulator [Pseudomonas chlororaphis subsp. piscium]AZC37391.1 Transcriptional regulator, DeoR family [Pseudomonas chlororaphis subsp. piscium]AZC43940.1 Transcriptional regulator, DeoR family [Pseudomonas chlororaphis subsp. piscium]
MSRTTRLLTLLQVLRGKRCPVTAAALAAELEVSERTLYRDIAELTALGAPIHGEAGIGYVLRSGLFLPPLMLNADETEAIVLGLRYVDQRGDEVLGKAAADALAKIAAVLAPAAQEALHNPTVLPGPPAYCYPENVVPLNVFRQAIREQAKLHIDYADVNKTPSQRLIWPLALGFMNEARVIVAWCELRDDFRTFRTDRIAAASEQGQRYPGRRSDLLRTWRQRMQLDDAGRFTPDKN